MHPHDLHEHMTTRRRLLAIDAALVLAAAAPLALAAAPATIRAVSLAIPPFGMTANGAPAGIFVDVMNELVRLAGMRVEQSVAPRPRAVAMLGSGEADLMIAFDNAQLAANAHHVTPVGRFDVVVVGRAGSRFASLADLRGKTVGHIRGSEYNAAYMADNAILKRETNTTEQSMRMLLEGRLDAIIAVRESLYYVMRTQAFERARFGPVLQVGRRVAWLHYSKQTFAPGVASRLRKAAETMRKSGALAAIVHRYLPGLDIG